MSDVLVEYNGDKIDLAVGATTIFRSLVSNAPMTGIDLDDVPNNPITDDLETNKQGEVKQLNDIRERLMVAAMPADAAMIKRRMLMPEIKKQMMPRWMITDEAQYAKVVNDLRDDDLVRNQAAIQQAAAAYLSKWSKVRAELTAGYDQQAEFRDSARESTIGKWIGGILATIGGWLWFWRVQRHQDRVLWLQTQPAESKPSHNGRHAVARPHASIRPR